MPKKKTPKRVKPSARSSSRTRDESSYSYVYTDGKPTHVMLPIDEFEELMLMEMANESIAVLEDPNTKWIDYDDWRLEEAGRMIAKARKAKDLTQTQLAKKLGIEQSQISRIERNPDRTTLRTLKKIAKALKVDVRSLID